MNNANVSRRTVLRGAAGAVTAGVAVSSVGTAAAQSSSEPDYGEWFENTDNFDGTVDETGKSEVTITVGASANGGNFGFGPAAVRVDPGTTVVWEWNGKGGVHNVAAEDGSFESEMVEEAGHTFEQTFDSAGVVKYACTPHKTMGMKGAVVVGDAAGASGGDGGSGTSSGGASEPDYGDWFGDVSNFDGTVDGTGQDEVSVTVGAEGNGGNFAFGPAAIRVDPGTTVVWEWNGKGGVHNVADDDGSFESEMVGDEGHTFSHTFQKPGVHRYVCAPHRAMGMKGAVVVESGGASGGSGDGTREAVDDALTIGSGLGLVGALLAMFAVESRNRANKHRQTDR